MVATAIEIEIFPVGNPHPAPKKDRPAPLRILLVQEDVDARPNGQEGSHYGKSCGDQDFRLGLSAAPEELLHGHGDETKEK